MEEMHLADVLARAKAGDPAAVQELVSSYEPLVRSMVKGRLPKALRSRFDTMDFVQLVWKSLFTEDGQDLTMFETEGRFIAFLSGVVRNKVYEQHRRLSETRKYDIGREQALYVRQGNREIPRELPAHDSTPSAEAQVGDRLAQILAGRGDFSTEVVHLRRQGHTYDEIAERLKVPESAARRVIQEMRDRQENRGWR